MRSSKPAMNTVTSEEARQQLDQLLKQIAAGESRILIDENGTPIAGLVSAEDLEFLARFIELRDRFQPLLDSWAAFQDDSPERIESEVCQAVDSMRQKHPVARSS